ncbi:hypothetical protein [Paenibacillus sp. MBLB4367]|uniref:hypothetical protein n=1 Tax=Paenibacillus sp. MBLB4367 TaxID=3384767 RepID=UPI0039082B67
MREGRVFAAGGELKAFVTVHFVRHPHILTMWMDAFGDEAGGCTPVSEANRPHRQTGTL